MNDTPVWGMKSKQEFDPQLTYLHFNPQKRLFIPSSANEVTGAPTKTNALAFARAG
jgi:hypothetical protein